MLHGTQGQVSPFEVDELRKEMVGWVGGGGGGRKEGCLQRK